MAGPVSRVLSSSQLETLAAHGEERTAEAGERLFEIGDESYPFVAIIEGEVAVTDPAGREIVRHGASGFLGAWTLRRLPLFLVAGTFFPLDGLPDWVQVLANFNPLFQTVKLVRAAAFGTGVWTDLLRVGMLVLYAFLMWRIAIRAMERKLVD